MKNMSVIKKKDTKKMCLLGSITMLLHLFFIKCAIKCFQNVFISLPIYTAILAKYISKNKKTLGYGFIILSIN